MNVLFPSTKAAVATDTLQMLVYDAPDDNACLDLVQRRRTSQDPSRRVITGQRSPLDTCSFIERASAVDLSLSYGRRAFFVLAQRQGSDFMIGCTLQGIGDADQSVDVALTPIDNTVLVPETTCDRLSSKCAGSCS